MLNLVKHDSKRENLFIKYFNLFWKRLLRIQLIYRLTDPIALKNVATLFWYINKSLKITCYALSKYKGSKRSLRLKTVIKKGWFYWNYGRPKTNLDKNIKITKKYLLTSPCPLKIYHTHILIFQYSFFQHLQLPPTAKTGRL